MLKDSPYHDVPKDYLGNLLYRLKLYEAAKRSLDLRRDLWHACSIDPLFHMGAFLWLYEPRPRDGKENIIPFIPWAHQEPVIWEIYENLGINDVVVEKSRSEGMSWIACMLALHHWLFRDNSAVGLISKTEADADNPKNPDSLFWKIDKQLALIPPWMSGRRNRDWERSIKDHVLLNRRNHATIRAYSSTGDVASGGRASFLVFDELAKFPRGADYDAMSSTQHVTESRIIISTPKGAAGAYYDIVHGLHNAKPIVLDWKDNPYRNRGLYRMEKGLVPVACDPENPLFPEYDPPTTAIKDLFNRLRLKGFVLEGTIRSPWYDRECDRPAATPQSIAQELDRSYGGSMYRIFGEDFFNVIEKTVRPPLKRGIVDARDDTMDLFWDESRDGPVLLWCSLDARDRPPLSRYVIGVDVSSGIAGDFTSNSVIQVLDLVSRKQVLEYATNNTPPAEFADVAVAMANWFHSAYLIWEHNGPGSAFGYQVQERGYTNVYTRKVQWKKRAHRKTRDVGWWTNQATKEILFSDCTALLRAGEYEIHSRDLMEEMGQYVREQGKIKHVKTVSDLDDEASHGDRVMAFTIALQGAKDRPLDRPKEQHDKEFTIATAPANTMAARMRWHAEQAQAKEEREVWCDVESSDLKRRRLAIR